jgi:hypothetical protein
MFYQPEATRIPHFSLTTKRDGGVLGHIKMLGQSAGR